MEQMEKMAVQGSLGVLAVCRSLEETARRWSAEKRIARLEDVPLLDDAVHGDEWLRERYQLDGPILMYVGNLEAYQGIDLLLQSFRIVCHREETATLVIIGGSSEHIDRYRLLAHRFGISDRIFFCGPRPLALLGFYLRQADILVSPRTQGNNTPMKIYSYLDASRAVLATDLPTHTQVLDPEIAYLVAPNPRDMAEGMRVLLADRELRERIGRNAKERVQEAYSLPAFERKLKDFYEALSREMTDFP
jgi:glycosyltransferase involved in cell wall biosynthesis